MKNSIIIVVVIILGLGAYYLFSKNSSPLPLAPTALVSNTPETPAPSSATVSIKNFSFNPTTMTVKTGTKVTWTNNDSVPHTVTSDSGNLLNSLTLSPGQSFSFTFANAGSINYHCKIHPMMKGGIIVTN